MRPHKVVFIDHELEQTFNSLDDKNPTKKALKRAIKDIQQNCQCGRNVKKQLIPKLLIDRHGITNLWVYNLPSAWRLFYSLTNSEEIELIAVVLDWMNHKEYERLFKFT